MDRRVFTVLGMSLLFALVVSTIFYQVAARAGNGPKRRKSEQQNLVIATRPLPVGAVISATDVKATKISADQIPKGAFANVEEVIGRPVVSSILFEEAVMEGRLAARGSGQGLAPVIPAGMRAVSVKVNEVVGVAGFVLPGMRVDVLVTGSPPDHKGSITTTVLQNIVVLSAGQNIQPDTRGQAVNVPVVTLLVTPEQAEILTLAGTEGHIQLVLRNGGDQKIEKPPGREIGELYARGRGPAPVKPPAAAKPRSAPKPEPVRAVPPPPPVRDEIIVFRGTQKTVEALKENR